MGGGGSTYDYGFRIYNPQIAKFLSVDPLSPQYPWDTPYQFAGNMPIWAIDLDGLEEYVVHEYFNAKGQIIKMLAYHQTESEGKGNFEVNVNESTGVQITDKTMVLVITHTSDGKITLSAETELSPLQVSIMDDPANRKRPAINQNSSDPKHYFAKGEPGLYDDISKTTGVTEIFFKQFDYTKIAVDIQNSMPKPSSVKFESASAILTSEGKAELDKLVSVLKATKMNVVVEGHTDIENVKEITDASGNKVEGDNQKLSEERAKSVKNYLAEKGIDATKISPKGYGDKKPIDNNNTAEGKSKNRRVEFKLQ